MNHLMRLQQIVEFAYNHTQFYHELYDRMKISVKEIHSIEELPIVTPKDLMDNGKHFKSDVQLYKVSMTSGSTSQPKMIYRTEKDFLHSVENETTLLHWAGIKPDDIVCVAQPFGINGYGELTAAACKQLKILCVPLGDTSMEMLIRVIMTCDVSVLDITPSRLWDLLHHPKFRVEKTRLRLAMVAGEYLSSGFKQAVEQKYNIQIVNQYGATECDCLAGEKAGENGLRYFQNDFICEIVDKRLVITSLYHMGTPLIRYMLGDQAELYDDRIIIYSRSDIFQLYDGIKLDSSVLSKLVQLYGGFQWQCLIFKKDRKICLEIHYSTIDGSDENSENLRKDVENSLDFWNIRDKIAIQCVCTIKMLTDGQRKVPRFIDLRNGDAGYLSELIEYGWINIFKAALPCPLTQKRLAGVSQALQMCDWEGLWNALWCCIQVWNAASRKIVDMIVVNALKTKRKQLLRKAQELSADDDWEIREDAAKLIGFILKNDFYELYYWAKEMLKNPDERLRRVMLVGLKYCSQYENDLEKNTMMLDLLDLLLYDKSKYVQKSFDSFVIGDGFLNRFPVLVDKKLYKWSQIDNISVHCKIIRVFKSSGGARYPEMAERYLNVFAGTEHGDLQRACDQTRKYLRLHTRR